MGQPSVRSLSGSNLDVRLGQAADLREAAAVVVEHLAAVGPYLPSLYLERGGRLRYQAQMGYKQVLDGFPPSAGVIGRTWRTGEPAVLHHTGWSSDYLAANDRVAVEICVPIRFGGRVVGVLNVESTGAVPADSQVLVASCATLFAEHLVRLGGLPPESPDQALARHMGALAGLADQADISLATAHAGTEVGGMGSGMVALVAPSFEAPREAVGPLASALLAIGGDGLETIATWVRPGTSCYTLGRESGEGFAGHELLRAAGAGSVVVVALAARGGFLGMLVVADASATPPDTLVVERLELLATQAATSLQTAAMVAELERRAQVDSLTGLGHQRAFRTTLTSLRSDIRVRAAVLVLDLDDFKGVNDRGGHLAGDRRLQDVATVLSGTLGADGRLFRIGGDEFAAIAAMPDEEAALVLGRRLHAAVRGSKLGTVSVGVAVARPDESDDELFERADAALYDAKADGRNSVRLARDLGARRHGTLRAV